MARRVLESQAMRPNWIAAVLLVGCVPSRSTIFDPVNHEVQRRAGLDVLWPEESRTSSAVDALLAQPIDLEAAVRISLARSHRLQARFDELGIAASQVADATVLPPLTADADYKRAVSGSGSEIEVTVVQDVLDLLQIGQRRGVANAELRGAQVRAIAATVNLAADVEMAFYELIASQQELELVQTSFEAANASAELVERQHDAGNTSDLALAREQEQRERFRIEIGRATQAIAEHRARLAALLGVDNDRPWTATGRLADPPATLPALDDLGAVATSANLDLEALRADVDAAAARHSYAMVRTFIPELGAGVALARRDAGGWEAGPAIRIGIPLFNQQQGPRAKALAEQARASNELAATRTEVTQSALTIRARIEQAFAEARQLVDVVMPLRKRVLEQTVLQYNAMNASTFELLMARRDMVDVGRQYVDALRNYWSAMAGAKALRRGGRAMLTKDQTR